jgi:hypothetical protein
MGHDPDNPFVSAAERQYRGMSGVSPGDVKGRFAAERNANVVRSASHERVVRAMAHKRELKRSATQKPTSLVLSLSKDARQDPPKALRFSAISNVARILRQAQDERELLFLRLS